jgi:hypothetical protein
MDGLLDLIFLAILTSKHDVKYWEVSILFRMIISLHTWQTTFEDTEGVIWNRKSKNNRQYNGQKIKDNRSTDI